MRKFLVTLLILILSSLPVPAALATENAFGRYVPGVFAGPASEIVPPVPGFYLQSSTFYYKATVRKDLEVPVGGTLKTNLSVEFFNASISGAWVPDWSPAEGVNVALSITLPFQTLYARANVGQSSVSDRDTGLGDILFLAAIGWHNGPHFAAANLGVYMPTGSYDKDNLANIGLNCWTFSPGLAYTYVNPAQHIDFSFAGGIDINTWNNSTNYRSGAMAHADATLLLTYKGFGAGVFGAVLYQVADDQGALADRLDGFRGRSFAIGPMIKYSMGGPHNFTANLNWTPEFGVKNRARGNGVFLNMSWQF